MEQSMSGNTYKTEEMIDGKIDSVLHFNLLEAIDWMESGIDVRLFRQDESKWIEVNHDQTKMQPEEKGSRDYATRLRVWLSDMYVQRLPDIEPCYAANADSSQWSLAAVGAINKFPKTTAGTPLFHAFG
jgi:hypothetical protein